MNAPIRRQRNLALPSFLSRLLTEPVGPTPACFHVRDTREDRRNDLPKRRPDTAIDDLILTNDTWGENGDADLIRQTASAVYAFSLNEGSNDAALVVTLAPGAYTVNARGKDESTGVALVEVYLVP